MDSLVTFVLVDDLDVPDAAKVTERAGALGLPITLEPCEHDNSVSFRVEGGARMLVTQMAAPMPDLEHHPTGVFAPPLDELRAARSHLIVAMVGLPSDPVASRVLQAVLSAAVVSACRVPIAVSLGGHAFYSAAVLNAFAEVAAREAGAPGVLLVDITWMVSEPSRATSFLTHGMARAGRDEELFLTCHEPTKANRDLMCEFVHLAVSDPSYVFPPSGHTIGRSADERILVSREPNPTGTGLPVIRLDAPT